MKRLIAVLLAALMLLCLLTSCGSKSINGTWTRQYTVLGVVNEEKFVFNGDGTGSITAALGIDVDMTYTVDGDKLAVTFKVLGIETTTEYVYEIKGEQLLLTADGETLTFEKQ